MSAAYANVSASAMSTAFGMERYRLNQRRNALPDIFESVDVIELSRKCEQCQLASPQVDVTSNSGVSQADVTSNSGVSQADVTSNSGVSQADVTSKSGGSQEDANPTAEQVSWQPPVPRPASPTISSPQRLSCTSCGRQSQEASDVDMPSPVKDSVCSDLLSFTDTTPPTKAEKDGVRKGSNITANNATNKESERENNKENDNKAKGHSNVVGTTNINEDNNINILHNNDNLIVEDKRQQR